jgi:3-methylcrotonyl-CoA carboxylase alpha subunit
MRIGLRHRHGHFVVDVRREGTAYRADCEDGTRMVEIHDIDGAEKVLIVDGKRHRVFLARDGSDCFVSVGGASYTFAVERGATTAHDVGVVAAPEVTAPMPGKVVEVLVRPGDEVDTGDGLVVLEAMKMENRLVAEAVATVAEVRVAAGDMVDGGQVLIVLRYEAAEAAP